MDDEGKLIWMLLISQVEPWDTFRRPGAVDAGGIRAIVRMSE